MMSIQNPFVKIEKLNTERKDNDYHVAQPTVVGIFLDAGKHFLRSSKSIKRHTIFFNIFRVV